jgi:tripartite-type tricarboxylate transporter receptor subunit TctC
MSGNLHVRFPRRTFLAAAALASTPMTGWSFNDTRPNEWVVGYSPGGGSDVVARLLADEMSRSMGQVINVLNKPGAGSNIAAEYVAKTREAQHTVMTADSAVLAANPFLYSKLSYSAERDFVLVGMIARFPLVLVVGPQVPAKNLSEFLAWAKVQTGGASYGSPGAGSPHHLVSELFAEQSGVKMTHVAYRGAAPAIQDVIGGQLPCMFVDTSSGGPYISSGKVRSIGVASLERLKTMPEVATLNEQGLKGFEAYAWQALVAPSAAPPELIQQLNKALNAALGSTQVKARMQALGVEPIASTPDEATRYARKERERWGKVIQANGIKLD